MNVPIRPIRFPSIRPCCSCEVCLLAGPRRVEVFARKLQGTPGCTVSVC